MKRSLKLADFDLIRPCILPPPLHRPSPKASRRDLLLANPEECGGAVIEMVQVGMGNDAVKIL